ncbi:hypothetical protein QR680_015474 [Steinernema hermaphroditum]|uniref:Uncharacterized protein n=1 Tax=Steinernema hermaphroditum TaxID=289476 RepID=A0AA39LKW6_9BILA|nr:hypothetical protein QR680_015474 [Steinernema hermaphroditum]
MKIKHIFLLALLAVIRLGSSFDKRVRFSITTPTEEFPESELANLNYDFEHSIQTVKYIKADPVGNLLHALKSIDDVLKPMRYLLRYKAPTNNFDLPFEFDMFTTNIIERTWHGTVSYGFTPGPRLWDIEKAFHEFCPWHFPSYMTGLVSYVSDRSMTDFEMDANYESLHALEDLQIYLAEYAFGMAIPIQCCFMVADIDASDLLEKDIDQINRSFDLMREDHYKNVLNGITAKVRELLDGIDRGLGRSTRRDAYIQESHYFEPDVNNVAGKIETFLSKYYNDSKESYNVFIWNKNCSVPSLNFTFDWADPSIVHLPGTPQTQAHVHKGYIFFVNRSAKDSKNRKIFEERREELQSKLYMESSGIMFWDHVDHESAKKSVEGIQQLHKFPFATAFVVPENDDNCVSSVNFEVIEREGIKGYKTYALFGF